MNHKICHSSRFADTTTKSFVHGGCKMANTALKVGQTVFYTPEKETWGKGRIVAISNGVADIYFVNPDVKLQSLPTDGNFTILTGKNAKDFILDARFPGLLKEARPKNFQGSLNIFLAKWPLGFKDPEYQSGEIDYKLEKQAQQKELLAEVALLELLEQENYAEIANRAMEIAKINLIQQKFDRARFIDALKQKGASKRFARSLYNLLYGTAPYQKRFTDFANIVERLHPAHSWGITTLYSFLDNPATYMFMKPEFTRNAADDMNFNLNYDATPNWLTYTSLVQFADFIIEHATAAGHPPRDYMDVQTFIYYLSNRY